MLSQAEWFAHPANTALDLGSTVDADDYRTLPDRPGLYSIWRDFDPDGSPDLLYVGRTSPRDSEAGVRRRVGAYLYLAGTHRPNETLYLHVVNHIVRPDLSIDDRTVTEVAVQYLRRCVWAGWAWERSHPALSTLERAAFTWGLSGLVPLLNEPVRRGQRGRLVRDSD